MLVASNTGYSYDRVDPGSVAGLVDARWIGRCKRDGGTHKIEGRLTTAKASAPRSGVDYVIFDRLGQVWTMGANGSDTSRVVVRCGDHWVSLRRVLEGTKKSKHECGARCTNATGPSCDCRCRGKNHGSNC